MQTEYISQCEDYLTKAIFNIIPHGKPGLLMLLLCSTPFMLGHADTSNGGSIRDDFDFDCDSAIAVKNIIETLFEMDLLQKVDAEQLIHAICFNARKCNLSEEYVKTCRREGQRWTCDQFNEDEANFTSSLMNIILDAYTDLGNQTIILDACGRTKCNYLVTNKLNTAKISVFVKGLYHVQFFNRLDNQNITNQLAILSRVFKKLGHKLGLEYGENGQFWDRFVPKVKVRGEAYKNMLVDWFMLNSSTRKDDLVFSSDDSFSIPWFVQNYAENNFAECVVKFQDVERLDDVTVGHLHTLMSKRGYDKGIAQMSKQERREALLKGYSNGIGAMTFEQRSKREREKYATGLLRVPKKTRNDQQWNDNFVSLLSTFILN